MSRKDNPFAVLVDDDDGSGLLATLSLIEAKSSAAKKPPKPDDGFHSKNMEYERGGRGIGRGGRARWSGRGWYAPTEATGQFRNGYGRVYYDERRGWYAPTEATGQFRNGYGRVYYDERGRSTGFGRGRGGGRGRGFNGYSGLVSDNQFNSRGHEFQQHVEHAAEEEGVEMYDLKSLVFGENRPVRYNNGPVRYNNGGLGWARRRFGVEDLGLRGGEEQGHRHNGGYSGQDRSDGRRYSVMHRGLQTRWVVRRSGSEIQKVGDNGKEHAGNAAAADDTVSACDMPEADPTLNAEATSEDASRKVKAYGKKRAQEDDKQDDNMLTLDEFQKLLHEKRKALEALKQEERKVNADEDFSNMQLIENKKKSELLIQSKSENDKLKNKAIHDKDRKIRKGVTINNFLKPAGGETVHYFGGRRGGGGRGGYRGGFSDRDGHGARSPALSIEDHGQFPLLGAANRT